MRQLGLNQGDAACEQLDESLNLHRKRTSSGLSLSHSSFCRVEHFLISRPGFELGEQRRAFGMLCSVQQTDKLRQMQTLPRHNVCARIDISAPAWRILHCVPLSTQLHHMEVYAISYTERHAGSTTRLQPGHGCS